LIPCALSGCPLKVERSCPSHVANPLVGNAAAFKLDVYSKLDKDGKTAPCAGNTVDHSSGAPDESHTYKRGEAIQLNVSPGRHTLVLTTFSDAAAQRLTGSACAEENLSAGAQFCFDLPVTASCSQVCGKTCCNSANGLCNDSCGLTCDAGWGDCNGDPSDGCEVNLAEAGQKVCGKTCINANSCCANDDCVSAPSPAACYAGVCPSAGGMCAYSEKSTATICGGTCCNSIGGTCKSDCSISCTGTNGNCNGDVGDGCEVDLTSNPNDCGACGRVCAQPGTKNVVTAGCAGGGCSATCKAGFSDCNRLASGPDDGCECQSTFCCNTFCPTAHDNGFGGHWQDCAIYGLHNHAQAVQAAHSYDATITPGDFQIDDMMGNRRDGVCLQAATWCACWVWSASGTFAGNGGPVGHARLDSTCQFPDSATGWPSWG
jgi:hypothetical protein